MVLIKVNKPLTTQVINKIAVQLCTVTLTSTQNKSNITCSIIFERVVTKTANLCSQKVHNKNENEITTKRRSQSGQ